MPYGLQLKFLIYLMFDVFMRCLSGFKISNLATQTLLFFYVYDIRDVNLMPNFTMNNLSN